MDLSLDDIIKINKKTNPKGRGGRGGRRSFGGVGQARNRRGSVQDEVARHRQVKTKIIKHQRTL